jgi:hypothetical protein
MLVRLETSTGGISPSGSSNLRRTAMALLLALVALATFGVRSAAAEEAPATVSGAVEFPGESTITFNFNSISGTPTSGSGTVKYVRKGKIYENGKFVYGIQNQAEGQVNCVDASLVEGGSEATVGGVITSSNLPEPPKYFRVTVFDSTTPGGHDAVGGFEYTETPGCTPEDAFWEQVTFTPAEYPGVTATGAVAPQTRVTEFAERSVQFPEFVIYTRATRPPVQYVATVPGSTFKCRFDEEAFHTCSAAGKVRPPAALPDGSHTFEVFATNAGHADATPAKISFVVDTVAPETILESGPSGLTADAEPVWTFTSDEPSPYQFECSLDAGSYEDCYLSYEPGMGGPLPDGKHTIRIRAVDEAGNVDASPVKISITVDATPPETTITSAPTVTKDTTPKIKFASSEAGSTFLCSFDSEPFGPCSNPAGSVPPAPLAEGQHTFEVEATDKVGNLDPSPASVTFTVDTTPPETTIVSGGPVAGSPGKAEFVAETTEGTLECKLDAGAWTACTSPVVYEGLESGAHTFRVRGIDAAGNADASPAIQKFKLS